MAQKYNFFMKNIALLTLNYPLYCPKGVRWLSKPANLNSKTMV